MPIVPNAGLKIYELLFIVILLYPPNALSLCASAPALKFRPFGYHISGEGSERTKHEKRYVDRWCQIGASIAQDAELISGRYTSFSVVDYGSNEGYFSLAIATSFPMSTIISVDFNEVFFGVTPRDAHVRHRKHMSASNNLICHSQYSVSMINSLLSAGVRVRYALVLSIFHWLPLRGRAEFLDTLCMAVQTAVTTFIELPEWGKNTTVNWEFWQHWYGPEDMLIVLTKALRGCACNPKVSFLGENTIDYGQSHPSTTTRKIFRIDLNECSDTKSTCPELFRGLQCNASLSDSCDSCVIPFENSSSGFQYCNISDFALSKVVLGKGYSSTVYAGTWRQREVALKISNNPVTALMSTAYSLQVRRSTGLAHLMSARLSHPNLNIPEHICLLPASNETVQVLPLLSGTHLRTVLAQGVNFSQVIEIAEQLGSALAFLHKHSLVYYDLHQEQVILVDGASGSLAVLLDIDQVQLLVRNKTACRCWTGDAFFSHVNAPESLQNCNLRQCGIKVDTYMFGVMLRTLYPAEPSTCGGNITCLVYSLLLKSCLRANPLHRPNMNKVIARLNRLKQNVQGQRHCLGR